MAKNQSVWGLDIGQCALKAIRLGYDEKADVVIVEGFDLVEHPKILSQPDADPDRMIRAALYKFFHRNDVKDCKIQLAIPGHQGIAKFVTLPPVEPKKIPEIVQYEAQMQIPFPLEEVVWDFQRVGMVGDDAEMIESPEVGIFGLKRDFVRRNIDLFKKYGIELDLIQLGPASLYNFAAYEFFLHAEEIPDGHVMFLDVGADKTDVVVTDGQDIWIRNVSIGGNHFTRQLAKDMKLSFAKAEHLKRNATKAPDPKKLYAAMRPVFQQFGSELDRSIKFFAKLYPERQVTKVVGVGNGFRLPGLTKFLQQYLKMPVERMNTISGFQGNEVLRDPTFNENLSTFAVCTGLALQGLEPDQAPLQTSLMPKEVTVERMVRKKKPWTLTAAAVLLLGFAVLFAGNYRILAAVENPEFKSKEMAISQTINKIQGWRNKYNSEKQKFEQLKLDAKEMLAPHEVEQKQHTAWLKVLDLIIDTIPSRDNHGKTTLNRLEEVNITEIDSVYLNDMGMWYDELTPQVRESMFPADKGSRPSGPGWVFEIRGYTFHDSKRDFVYSHVLRKFQEPEIRKYIRFAAMRNSYIDSAWSPRKEPQSSSWASIGDLASRFSSGKSAHQNQILQKRDNDDAIRQIQKKIRESHLPFDFVAYLKAAADGFELPPEEGLTLTRTDFSIQFVWTGQEYDKSQTTAPTQPGQPGLPGQPGMNRPGQPGTTPGQPGMPGPQPYRPGAPAGGAPVPRR